MRLALCIKLVQPFGSTNCGAFVNDALTLSGQVAQRLRARIADGTWSAGATLPAERRLATELGVSRGSLRAGIAQLQAEGLVEARQGSGTRVCADMSQVPLDWMSWVLAHEGLDPKEALVVIEQLVALRRTVALHVSTRLLMRLMRLLVSFDAWLASKVSALMSRYDTKR